MLFFFNMNTTFSTSLKICYSCKHILFKLLIFVQKTKQIWKSKSRGRKKKASLPNIHLYSLNGGTIFPHLLLTFGWTLSKRVSVLSLQYNKYSYFKYLNSTNGTPLHNLMIYLLCGVQIIAENKTIWCSVYMLFKAAVDQRTKTSQFSNAK